MRSCEGSDSLTAATETYIRDFVHSRIVMLDPSSVEVDASWENDNSAGNVVQVQAPGWSLCSES